MINKSDSFKMLASQFPLIEKKPISQNDGDIKDKIKDLIHENLKIA